MPVNPLGTPTLPPQRPEPDLKTEVQLKIPRSDSLDELVGSSAQARADLHVQTVCMLILAFVATGVALFELRPVLVPFVLALFFAACLKPLIEFQRRYLRAPQPVAVAGTIILAAAIITLIGIPLSESFQRMWPIFRLQFNQFVEKAAHIPPLQRLGFAADTKLPDQPPDWMLSAAGIAAGKVTDFATATFLVIIFALFILLGRPGEARPKTGLLAEIEVRVQRYIGQMVLLSAITGISVGVVLFVLGVKFAAVFGFLAFLLNFIPTIGSIIATLLPLPIILLSPELGVTAKVLALVIPAVIQLYLGNALQPRVLGNALDLHPIVVLISLIFWSMIWGLAGAFLATPMTAVLKIVLEKIPATRPLAALLAGRLELVF